MDTEACPRERKAFSSPGACLGGDKLRTKGQHVKDRERTTLKLPTFTLLAREAKCMVAGSPVTCSQGNLILFSVN